MYVLAAGMDQWVGIGAGVLTATSMIPQVIKVIQEKKATQVSVLMLIVLLTGVGLWVWYGILKTDWPIIITNCFSFLVNIVLLFLRFRYRNNK